jgi:hypothetical protein
MNDRGLVAPTETHAIESRLERGHREWKARPMLPARSYASARAMRANRYHNALMLETQSAGRGVEPHVSLC